MEGAQARLGRSANGWIEFSGGPAAFYGGDFLRRAAVNYFGIFANDREEALYPMTASDAAGEPLAGGHHCYSITFGAGRLPPVRSFWSVTAYDRATGMLAYNDAKRYVVASETPGVVVPGAKCAARAPSPALRPCVSVRS